MKTIFILTLLALVLVSGCFGEPKEDSLCPSGICQVMLLGDEKCVFDLNSSWQKCEKLDVECNGFPEIDDMEECKKALLK